MTNIKFKFSKSGQHVQMDDKNKNKDFEKYFIQSVVVYTKNWENEQNEWHGIVDENKFNLTGDEIFPLWLGVLLRKKDPSLKRFKSTRFYYLHLKQNPAGGDILVETYSKPRLYSGYAKANAWESTIWRENNDNLIEKYNETLRFYLLNCPSKAENSPSKQFTDLYLLWGKNCFSRDKNQLRAKLLNNNVKGIGDKTGGVANSANDMKHRVEAFELSELRRSKLVSFNKESRIVMVDNLKNQCLSLFRHLRNSIAHGSFLIYTQGDIDYYIFQDSCKEHITARGIIDIKILENWKDIILSKN